MTETETDTRVAAATRLWHACLAAAIALVAVSISPWTLAPGALTPTLLGLPRALWVGFVVAGALLVVVVLGAWAQARRERAGAS